MTQETATGDRGESSDGRLTAESAEESDDRTLQLNVTYEGGEAVSVKHETHHVSPPKSAWWIFKIEDGVAGLSQRSAGCRRVSEDYVISLEDALLELSFVELVDWDKYRDNEDRNLRSVDTGGNR